MEKDVKKAARAEAEQCPNCAKKVCESAEDHSHGGHDHEHEEADPRREWLQILAGGILFLAVVLFPGFLGKLLPFRNSELILFLFPYIWLGAPVWIEAFSGIRSRQFLDENALMAIASLGALVVGEYPEAVAVMFLYRIGEALQTIAVRRSRRSIAELMDIRPDHANVEREDGLRTVKPEEVEIGETVLVQSGERIPLDGTILEGFSALDTSALTGEAMPREVGIGDGVFAGCINGGGQLRIRVEKAYGQSTAARVLALVEDASSRKAQSERFISRFARIYTPAVVGAAALLTIVPPLFWGEWMQWLTRACTFLVISCPCALVISVPMTFFAGIGGLSRMGVLVKGGNYIEALAKVDAVVMDKTGTLTTGQFDVEKALPSAEAGTEDILELAALCESASTHPIARSLVKAYGKELPLEKISRATETRGRGASAIVEGREILAGSARWMQDNGVGEVFQVQSAAVHVAADGKYMGCLLLQDQLKPDAREAVQALREAGVRKIVMLSGDTETVAAAAAERLKLDQGIGGCLPDDKVAHVEALMAQTPGKLLFVGDGINDAPVLARADIGAAMGALGSDAAIEAADVVLMDDRPSSLAPAILMARRICGIARQNIFFTLAVKLLVLTLGAAGLVGMWAAVAADVGVALLATANALRAMHPGKNAE